MKKMLGVLTLLLGVAVLAGWQDPAGAAQTKTVIDSTGRQVTFAYPVKRMIVTDDTIADPVRLFGKQNLVVGVENSISSRGYFPEMAKQPMIGNQWGSLNWELILSLKPDIILMPHHPTVTPRVTAEADRLGIPILAIQWHYPEHMAEAVTLLGEVFGERDRANEFKKWRRKHLDLIARRLQDLPAEDRKTAYVEAYASGPVGRAAGKGMPADGTLQLAGLINVCQFEWSKEVSDEWIMARNPDLIIMNDYGGSGEMSGYLVQDETALREHIKKVEDTTKFQETKAVANNNVYIMSSRMRGGIHMVGALYMAKAAYPERFQDIDPEKSLQEYFERWMNLPYQGKWFFPQP